MKKLNEKGNILTVKGASVTAKIFTKNIEETAKEQIKSLCDMKIFKGRKIRIMPDVHAGAGCTIGTTMTVTNATVPNLVGVDIGCGMETVKISNKNLDLKALDKLIHDKIPSGFKIRALPHEFCNELKIDNLICRDKVDLDRAYKSIGTLGGGNHFIEVDKDEKGVLYLVVHSGSRNLGNQVAKIYQEKGYNDLKDKAKEKIETLIKKAKKEGVKNLEGRINEIKQNNQMTISPSLAFVKGKLFEEYLHDMIITQHYAMINRKAIVDEIIKGMNLKIIEHFTTVHNYIDTDSMILRKGAVSANKEEKLLIPINMRDGSLICIGKGNTDWNCSAPHGAGRLMSRQKAKEVFSLEQYQKSMTNIFTTSVNKWTLDECPMAYKNMEEIMKNIEPTAEVICVIKPIYNFKAAD